MKFYNIAKEKSIKIGPYTTSKTEIYDLIKSWIVITIIISILGIGEKYGLIGRILFSALTVGLAFLFHELGHKIMAQHYGCFAEYRANNQMLGLALFMSLLGFVFLAPGAVIISGPAGKRRNGIISAAGPGTNFIMAIILVIISLFVTNNLVQDFCLIGIYINGFIGLFNMIPFGMFDGKKILNWNKAVYFTMLFTGIFLTFFVDKFISVLI